MFLSMIFVLRNPWIIEINICHLAFEYFNYTKSRTFSIIINILLVCNTKNKYLCSVHSFLMTIQNLACALYAVFRHLIVNNHRSFDHRCMESILSCFPCKVIWIKRDTVSAKSRTWIECLETIWFCLSSINNFPHADSHSITEHSQFIYKTNVDISICVFKDLLHLSDCR